MAKSFEPRRIATKSMHLFGDQAGEVAASRAAALLAADDLDNAHRWMEARRWVQKIMMAAEKARNRRQRSTSARTTPG
ncbi:hypothetical protein AA23498_1337 [Acetobacter nitrogenifigens DSM 23921 = NBRC 105050]|nr:hypothetical protein AA23498_1337 [Acetobacter nitrogenifigens DSM 23921 = NBRC 105050]